jgi:hypothetical protein
MNNGEFGEGLAKLAMCAVGGFVTALGTDAEHDAYNQEIHDPKHAGENVPTHVAHAIGRGLGVIIKSSISPN